MSGPGIQVRSRSSRVGVGWDEASASGSLRRLDFHVRYLARGGGRIVGHDNKAVILNGGDVRRQESRYRGGWTAVMYITKLIWFLGTRETYILDRE